MDIFDKFFKKFAYKFNKGYPDLNNNQDVLLLESLFEKLNIKVELKEDKIPNKKETIQAIQQIINQVGNKYNLFAGKSNPNRIGSMGKIPESDFIKAFKEVFGENIDIELFGPRQGSNPSGSFNMYSFNAGELGQVNIIVSRSEPGGRGKSNEALFIDTLNMLIEQAEGTATIIISSPEYNEVSNNVTYVSDSSKTGAGKGDKSDVQFLSGQPGSDKGEVVTNISLKQDGGFRWASVFKDEKKFITTFQERALPNSKNPIPGLKLIPNPDAPGKYLMADPKTGARISKIVIPDLIGDDKVKSNNLIFGPENPKVIIVSRTWKESDFELNPSTNTITVKATNIYKTLEDVTKSGLAPVFIVTQHEKKPIGLDYRVVPANMATTGGPRSSAIELSVKDII